MLLELLPIYKDFKDTGYQIRFEQIECSLFNEKKKEFDNLLGTRYNILLWRVVRVVEGAALEILRGAVRFVHQKPCSHAGFTRFEN